MGLLQRIKHMAGWDAPAEQAAPGAERRHHRRLQTAKLSLSIGGKRYKTSDWSLGGLRITVPNNKLAVNDIISGALTGPGMFDRGTYEATVVWVGDKGELGACFIEISPESFMAMSAAQL